MEVEAESEAIFENHLEAEVEAEALVKKNWKRKGKRFKKNLGGSGSRSEFFFLLEAEAEFLKFFLKAGSVSRSC